MATVTLQVTARSQCWAWSVPWWQPMKIPQWCDSLSYQNCFALCKTYWEWKRVMGVTLWCCLLAKFDLEFESNFQLVSSFWKVFFPVDGDQCGEYRQPIVQVGGALIYSPQFSQSNWPTECQPSYRLCENVKDFVDGFVQGCSISSVLAMEILQTCTKPSMCYSRLSWCAAW